VALSSVTASLVRGCRPPDRSNGYPNSSNWKPNNQLDGARDFRRSWGSIRRIPRRRRVVDHQEEQSTIRLAGRSVWSWSPAQSAELRHPPILRTAIPDSRHGTLRNRLERVENPDQSLVSETAGQGPASARELRARNFFSQPVPPVYGHVIASRLTERRGVRCN
jgi:hypothetical protein